MAAPANSRIPRTILLLIAVCLVAIPAYAKYGGGSGTADDPYQIATAADLIALGETPEDYDKHFILTLDIDLDPALFGRKVFDKAVISPFTGVFDGNAHTISHLTINGGGRLGLFGQMSGEVKDLGVVHVNITGSGDPVGGLVRENRGTLTRCYSTGVVSGTGSNVGGLVGYNNGGSIAASYSTSTVRGSSRVGGLVGRNSGNVTGCYSSGPVSGTGYYYVGGLVGSNDRGGSIATSSSTGSVSATGWGVGGVVGYNNGGSIATSYSTGTVIGREYVGGLVGQNSGNVTGCYSSGAVSGTGYYAGGLVGYNSGSIATTYSTGAVSGENSVGGLVGRSSGSIATSYSTGLVTGSEEVGGLVGSGSPDRIQNSVWDTETSGASSSAGGFGLTRPEMMDPYMLGLNGFANDPNWVLDAGRDYPRLAWQGTPGEIIPEPDINWLEGCGTAEDPYRIDTAEQLIFLGRASALCDSYFVLSADIDLGPNLPGRQLFRQAVIPTFTGVFDGNGHTISNLTIEGGSYLGLFGRLESGAEVKNLGVLDVNIAGSGGGVGGVVGYSSGNVIGCYSTGMVNAGGSVGGLVGENYGGSIATSYSTGAVSGTSYVGGLVGWSSGNIATSYSNGAVSGTSFVGGLAGFNSGSVLHSVWDMDTSGLSASTGGVGLTTAEMMDPYMLGLNGFANNPNWVLDAGRDYPRLAWEGTPGQIIAEPAIDWLEGGGTAEDPYRIDTAEQLIFLRRASALCDRHVVLGANIDLDPDLPGRQLFRQAVIPTFTGVFDGNGHTISHLTITGGDCVGLFGRLAGEVKDIGVVDVNISNSGRYVGGLVGINGGGVTACYSTGAVSGTSYVGGLVGSNEDAGGLTQCYGTGLVMGLSEVGGLVGSNEQGVLTECYNAGVVIGAEDVGGLVGRNDGGPATHCYSTGTVIGTGSYYVGGLVGRNDGGPVTHCYSTATVIATGNYYVGGLVGWNDGTITTSYSTGSVSGTGWGVGGLVGNNGSGGSIATSYSSGAVSGNYDVGGLVGGNDGTVVQCYSTGTVGGTGWAVGGLVGSNGGDVTHCYSTGVVSGNSSVGGVIGENGGNVTQCHSTGSVTGSSSVGGLVGRNLGDVAKCHSTGSASGSSSVGGLVGSNGSGDPYDGLVRNCYSTGTVKGNESVGGLVGSYWYGGITTSYSIGAVNGNMAVGGLVGAKKGRAMGVASECFWDIQTSGQATSAGGTGKTTAEMQMASTYLDAGLPAAAGWDFVGESQNGTEDIWAICEGGDYPHLAWEFVIGDFDADADTDFADFCILAEHWLAADGSFWCGQGCDLTNDGSVNWQDLMEFTESWLGHLSSLGARDQ
jgi:hypothetical protein